MTQKHPKPNYKRQQYWVDAPLQLQMVGYVLVLISASLLLTAFSVYRGVQESSFQSRQIFHSLEWINQALRAPMILASAISLLAGGLLTLFWSHRFAGPLRVIAAGMARIRHGNLAVPVRVRTTDAHKDLASEFQKMQDELKKMIATDRERIATAIECLKADKPDVEKALAELKHVSTHFHV
jgi:nitrogen fixation/metabolism regulation signal transduction histidine kinase